MQWGELTEERECGEGANGEQRGRGEGCQGFICLRWSRFRVDLMETIRWLGRLAGDGVVDWVQWCKRGARACAASAGARLISVRVHTVSVSGRTRRGIGELGVCVAWVSIRCSAEQCKAQVKWTCTRSGTHCTLSASTARARPGQSEGYGGTYGWLRRLAVIGRRRWWLEGADGEAATTSLPSKPQSPRVCARSVSAREREKVRCRGLGDWRVGSWGSSWAAARRRLGVWSGEGEREGVGQSLQDCLGSHPSLVSTSYRTRRIREGERRVAG
jgi:hypothetical protein